MSDPIKDALGALSRHANLVSAALDGPIEAREVLGERALVELRQASALRPAGDDTYRLHPRLREYLYDHLQLYPAFQSLSQIGADIAAMRQLWIEIGELRYVSDTDTLNQLRDRLQDTVFNIADSMQRNLAQLQSLLSTRYGNVKSIAAKKRQNNWYMQQSGTILRELTQLSAAGATIERDAFAIGMLDVARFVRRNLLSLILGWQQGLSEMQTLLSREIFRTHEVELQHKQLARIDALLRQQPGWMGVEIEFDAEIPDFLLATCLPKIRPHVEPEDGEKDFQALLIDTAKNLPALAPPPQPKQAERIKRKEQDHVAPPKTPAMLASERLYRDVMASADGVSLLDWRKGDADAQTMSPNVWLIFAVMDLRQQRVNVALVQDGPITGPRRSPYFVDAVASGPRRRWGHAGSGGGAQS